CDSAINEGFNTAKPWADAVISNRPFAGNTGSVDDNDEIQRNLNDTNYNRMWEYNNRGVGSKVVAFGTYCRMRCLRILSDLRIASNL
ncbi:hypothetical protein ACUOA8_55710, partial [Escherichia sp. SS-MK2]